MGGKDPRAPENALKRDKPQRKSSQTTNPSINLKKANNQTNNTNEDAEDQKMIESRPSSKTLPQKNLEKAQVQYKEKMKKRKEEIQKIENEKKRIKKEMLDILPNYSVRFFV